MNRYLVDFANTDDCSEVSTSVGDESCGSSQGDSGFYPDLEDHGSLSYLLNERPEEYNNSYHIIAANKRAGLPIFYGTDQDEDPLELCYEGDAWKICWQGNDDGEGISL